MPASRSTARSRRPRRRRAAPISTRETASIPASSTCVIPRTIRRAATCSSSAGRTAPSATTNEFQLPAESVECVATIPYQPNLLVFFPQGIDAIHGVSVRQPTPHFRRYVFLTAELADDWLISPAAPEATA